MTSLDEQVQQLVAERDCERLVLEYAWLVDSGAASGVADLFTDDGVWLGADRRGMEGQGEIRKAFTQREGLARRQSRHVMTNVRINRDGADHAVGTAYLINYRHDATEGVAAHPAPADHPKFVGDYHFTFRRTPVGWRIESLRFELAFLRERRAQPR
jgi:ketosteroid isomerase-like protein